MAFTQNISPTFPKQPQAERVQVTSGSLTGVCFTAGASGSKVISVFVASNDTTGQNLTLNIVNAAVTYPLSNTPITIGAGTLTTATVVNLLTQALIPGIPLDSDGNPYILLVSGDTLSATASTVSGSKTVTIHTFGADF